MSKIVHQSQIKITRVKGPTRKAVIEGHSAPIYYGVHGGIKGFYKIDPEKEHAATLDHIVGAVGGWMMGTFATMLAKERIATPKDRYHADATGDIEAVEGILKIVRINVSYTLKVSPEKRDAAQAAFENYLPHCPAAASVIDAIEINHDVTFVDL